MTPFAHNIKALRLHAGATQADMAAALGIPRSSWSGYENAVSEPNYDTLCRIQEHFNVGADVLLRAQLYKYTKEQLAVVITKAGPRPVLGNGA